MLRGLLSRVQNMQKFTNGRAVPVQAWLTMESWNADARGEPPVAPGWLAREALEPPVTVVGTVVSVLYAT